MINVTILVLHVPRLELGTVPNVIQSILLILRENVEKNVPMDILVIFFIFILKFYIDDTNNCTACDTPCG